MSSNVYLAADKYYSINFNNLSTCLATIEYRAPFTDPDKYHEVTSRGQPSC